MPSITFMPMAVTLSCEVGDSLFDIARKNGVPVATACAGKATCGLCRMKVLAGEQHLTAFGAGERKHLGNVYFITKERLSCQARLKDDGAVTVLVPIAKLNEPLVPIGGAARKPGASPIGGAARKPAEPPPQAPAGAGEKPSGDDPSGS